MMILILTMIIFIVIILNQEFYGVPLEGDVGREAYQLVCADTQGLMAIDGIEV